MRRTQPHHYDHDWGDARAAHLDAHPTCQIRVPGRCTGTATEVDHVVPLTQGGARLDPANLQSTCHPCHAWKTWHEDGAERTSALRHAGGAGS